MKKYNAIESGVKRRVQSAASKVNPKVDMMSTSKPSPSRRRKPGQLPNDPYEPIVRKNDTYDQIEKKNDQAYEDQDLEGIKEYKDLRKGAYKRKTNDAFGVQAPKKRVRHPILQGATKSDLKRGIIYSEILGKPKALQ